MREPLVTICAEPGMPSERTIYQWRSDYPGFAQDYARAREARAESRADRIDQYIQEVRDGTLDANAARVIIDAEKWQAGKELPKRFGERLKAELSGPGGGPIEINTKSKMDLARWIAFKLSQANAAPQIEDVPDGATDAPRRERS